MSNTTPSSGSLPPSDNLAKQVKLLKAVSITLCLIIAGGAGFFLYSRHIGQPVAILIDGTPIATVRNASLANQILDRAVADKAGPAYAANNPVRLQKIQLQRVGQGATLDPDDVAEQKLAGALKIHVHAFVIFVDGHPSVGLPTSEDAAETLADVKDHFAKLPPDAKVVGDPDFVDKVEVHRIAVDTSQTRNSPDDAAPYFWTPPPAKTYVVQPGDVGVKIARRNHISLSDFLVANKDRDMNKLMPGDTVNVQKMPMLISVRVQKEIIAEEKINEHAEGNDAGKRRLTYTVTYVNGEETRRDVQDIVTLVKPRARMSL
jgi:hypothetical protein